MAQTNYLSALLAKANAEYGSTGNAHCPIYTQDGTPLDVYDDKNVSYVDHGNS